MQKGYYGKEAIGNLSQVIKKEKVNKIFLVTGKESFKISGAEESLNKILESCEIERFMDFSSNPKLEEINRGLAIFRKNKFDLIIAVGGGSSIDVAKAIKLFYYRECNKKVPMVAIPTTTGTGSESTYFIVYYKGKDKISEGIPEITLPEYYILERRFLASLPSRIVAETALDAFSQSIESYWSIHSTDKSKSYAEKAIKLILDNILRAVNDCDLDAREKLLEAANFSGRAINISKTTVCHSIAYPITSYFGVAHGHAAALTLGEILVFNSKVSERDCADKRGVGYAKQIIDRLVKILGVSNPEEARQLIQKLMQGIKIETRLSSLGISSKKEEIILEHGFNPERVRNNPRILSREDLAKILNNIY